MSLCDANVQAPVRIGYGWIYCKTWFGLGCCCSWKYDGARKIETLGATIVSSHHSRWSLTLTVLVTKII
jgi:hypothetical protein